MSFLETYQSEFDILGYKIIYFKFTFPMIEVTLKPLNSRHFYMTHMRLGYEVADHSFMTIKCEDFFLFVKLKITNTSVKCICK